MRTTIILRMISQANGLRAGATALAALLLLALSSGTAYASTFVGNGGNAGDVEWQVTMKQINAAVSAIQKDPPDDELLCSCDDVYANASTCDALNNLSVEQRKFCGQTLKAQVNQLAPLVRDTNTVHVSWTTESIDVLEEGHRRSVDAVTDRTRGTVTLNAAQFRALNPSERVFLIGHELMHLTTLAGQPLTDEGPQGPFISKEGSRQLVNAMAASLVIEAEEANAFERYSPVLRRPQGWKMNWIDLNATGGSSSMNGTYNVRDFSGGSLRFTHYFTALGVNADYTGLTGKRTVLGSATAEEHTDTFKVGLSYRLFPFSDPLTSFGQSNFVFSADVDFVRGHLNLRDPFNDETSTSSRVGASGMIRYYFPIIAGLWFDIAEAYESLPGPYTIPGGAQPVPVDNDKNIFATSIGVSYAF